jgi:hypothetical protein
MNQLSLTTALDLHQKAFAFLMECRASGCAGSHPFDESTLAAWRSPEACIQWVARNYDQLSLAHRPPRDQLTEFARFLCSLFATSFSVCKIVHDGETRIQVRALASRRLDGTKKSIYTKTKERRAADLLLSHAFVALAAEIGLEQPPIIPKGSALEADLALWAWAVQLVNRANFASQGPAVHLLWLDVPEKTRRQLNPETVWLARQRLINHLSSSQPANFL